MNSNSISAWLHEVIDDFRFQSLNDMTRTIITQAIQEGMPAKFLGEYTVHVSWDDPHQPHVGITFANEHEHLMFSLRYP